MSTPDFAIFQNSKTRHSAIWTKERGEWVDATSEEYDILGLLARTLRTTPDPSEVVKMLAEEARRIDDKKRKSE
jgi:hypothetical protein